MIVIVRGQPLREAWAYKRFSPEKDNIALTPHHFLGFGYAKNLGNPLPIQTIIIAPMWFASVLAAMPPLWLYRRQRKRRKIGFPVEPIATNSGSNGLARLRAESAAEAAPTPVIIRECDSGSDGPW